MPDTPLIPYMTPLLNKPSTFLYRRPKQKLRSRIRNAIYLWTGEARELREAWKSGLTSTEG